MSWRVPRPFGWNPPGLGILLRLARTPWRFSTPLLSRALVTDGGTEQADKQSTSDADRSHLADLPDGCGCAEVWEFLSERQSHPDDGEQADDDA